MTSNPGEIAGAAVDRFFERVLSDPSLAPRFEGAALHQLAAQQQTFVAHALGSPFQPGLPAVTAGPGTERALAEHLAAALRDVGVAEESVARITDAALHPTPVTFDPPAAGPPSRPSFPLA